MRCCLIFPTTRVYYLSRLWFPLLYSINTKVIPNLQISLCHICAWMKNTWNTCMLKLPSLFAAWLFWTFHTKSHNMKALVILSHSWSSFLPLTCLHRTNELLWVSVSPSVFIFILGNTPPRLPMQITWPWSPVGRFLCWPDYCKTNENVNITLLDLCLFTFYSVHFTQ